MNKARSFHVSVVLSVVTGVFFKGVKIDELYQLLEFLLNENLVTLDLRMAMKAGSKILINQYPTLSNARKQYFKSRSLQKVLTESIATFGEKLKIKKPDCK
jgi:hypothetical protein